MALASQKDTGLGEVQINPWAGARTAAARVPRFSRVSQDLAPNCVEKLCNSLVGKLQGVGRGVHPSLPAPPGPGVSHSGVCGALVTILGWETGLALNVPLFCFLPGISKELGEHGLPYGSHAPGSVQSCEVSLEKGLVERM